MNEVVGGIQYDVTLDLSQLSQAEKDVARKLGRIGDEGQKLQTKFTAIAAGVSAAISAIAIEGLVSKIVSAQRQFDVLYSSLKTVTGGADAAGVAWDRLTNFASKTPYTLDQTVKGFVKLKALGLDPSERAMTSFGNTASAMGKDLTQMIEAVADASTGEFERLKEFGIKARTQGDQVSFTFQGVTTTVKNSASDITEYLTKIGEVNFAGAMQTRMDTLDGAMSNLEDSWQALYLSISKSGVGDLIGDMVKQAANAIQELSTSIESGGLTEHFDTLRTMMKAAEVVGVSLAGALVGRMIPAISALVIQAGFAAAATVTMTSAASAFSAVISALGGPVGIAITALGLLALNWDSVSGAAKNAADVSEESAKRIAKAQTKSAKAATLDLNDQLKEAIDGLKQAQESRARTISTIYRRDAKDADLAAIDERIAAYKQSINDIKNALAGVENRNNDALRMGAGPRGGAGAGYDITSPEDAGNQDKLDKWIRRYGTLAQQLALEIKEAKKELGAAFTPDLEKQIRSKFAERSAKVGKPDAGDPLGDFEKEKVKAQEGRDKKALDQGLQLNKAINPIDALKMEYDAKLELVTLYEGMMAQVGVDATEQAELARTQITRENELQRMALAEQTFRSQGEAQAFLMDTLNSLSQTASSSIVGLINGTMSAQDAMRALGNTILQEAVRSLVQIGLQQVKNAVLSDTLAAAEEASLAARMTAHGSLYAASVAAQVEGMSALAAQNAYAATAAIPGVGPGLAPGAAATAGAAAAAIGAPAVATAPIAGARQYGGAVTAGSLYRVNETGQSEMFVGANGNQYMIPGRNGRVVAADDLASGGTSTGGGVVQHNSFSISIDARGNSSMSSQSSSVGINPESAKQLAQMISAGAKDTLAREMRPGGLIWKMKQGQA